MLLHVVFLLCVPVSVFSAFSQHFNEASFIDEDCLNYTVYPLQYEVTITPHIYLNQSSYYDCVVSITVIASGPSVRVIELDARNIKFEYGSVNVYRGSRNIAVDFKMIGDKLCIYLSEPMVPFIRGVREEKYIISIVFRKYLHAGDVNSGIMLVPYDDNGPKYLFVTRLSPNKARDFFPCFDHPRFDAGFRFRVNQQQITPSKTRVQFTNTSLVIAKEHNRHKSQEQHEYIIIEYLPSPQIGPYQVGFHYSQFGNRQVTAKSTNDTIVIWAPTRRLRTYDFIVNFSQKMLDLIIEYSTNRNEYSYRPLVYGPINVVSVPLQLDGYEIGSWNLLTNSEIRLSHSPEYTSIRQEEQITYELALQMCRIWLGNPGELEKTRWEEEWFKEGFANYLAHFFLNQYWHRRRVPMSTYGLQMKHKAMSLDWDHKNPALISLNKALAVEIEEKYIELVQMKTASLLWMVENWVESDRFHMAFVKYMNARRGKEISLIDFMTQLDLDTVDCLSQFANGTTATKILNSWFSQNGYPVIRVEVLRQTIPNIIQLKQHKYSFTDKIEYDSRYLIPVSYIVQNRQNNCYNCLRPRFTITQTYTFKENLNDGWIILNANASGYYRVNYDEDTWKLIIKTLKEDHLSIPEENRAQIVNDAFALYIVGELDHALAVGILDYLDQEMSHLVWEAAISGFELLKIEEASHIMTSYFYNSWKEFMRKKVAPIYAQLAEKNVKNHWERMFRRNIVSFACAVEYDLCLNLQKHYYSQRRRLDADTRQTCYEVHIHDNPSPFAGRSFNAFEVEDKTLAEKRIAQERRFKYSLPLGGPLLDNLISSTTVPQTQTIINTPLLHTPLEAHQTNKTLSVPRISSTSALIIAAIVLAISVLIMIIIVVVRRRR